MIRKKVEETLNQYHFNGFPNDYKEKLISTCEVAYDTFGTNLKNITLGGSGGKNNLIPGWSDIDIFIILHEYNQEKIQQFYSVDDKNIHVGTTFYTVNEIKNKMIDGKTTIMIYEKTHFNVNPTLYGEEVFMKNTFKEVKENDRKNLYNSLGVIRRIILDIKSHKTNLNKSHIKKLLVLLKCILSQNNIFAYGYNNVFSQFSKLYYNNTKENIKDKVDFDIVKIIEDKSHLENYNQSYIDYFTLVNEFIINKEDFYE